jgi:hypothetical protein
VSAAADIALTRVYEGCDPLGFVVSLNLQQRQLTPEQLTLVRDRLYNETKKPVHDGGARKSPSGDQNDRHLKTAETIAWLIGFSGTPVISYLFTYQAINNYCHCLFAFADVYEAALQKTRDGYRSRRSAESFDKFRSRIVQGDGISLFCRCSSWYLFLLVKEKL